MATLHECFSLLFKPQLLSVALFGEDPEKSAWNICISTRSEFMASLEPGLDSSRIEEKSNRESPISTAPDSLKAVLMFLVSCVTAK